MRGGEYTDVLGYFKCIIRDYSLPIGMSPFRVETMKNPTCYMDKQRWYDFTAEIKNCEAS